MRLYSKQLKNYVNNNLGDSRGINGIENKQQGINIVSSMKKLVLNVALVFGKDQKWVT